MAQDRITTPVSTEQAIKLLMAVPGEHRITDPELARSVLNVLRAGKPHRMLAAGPLGSGKVVARGGTLFWTRNPKYVHASLRDIDAATR